MRFSARSLREQSRWASSRGRHANCGRRVRCSGVVSSGSCDPSRNRHTPTHGPACRSRTKPYGRGHHPHYAYSHRGNTESCDGGPGVGCPPSFSPDLACWVYAPGPQPYFENDPLDLSAEGTGAIVVEGIVTLERLTLTSPPLKASFCVTVKFTAREPAATSRPDRLLSTSTQRPTRRCSPSKEPNRGFSISPRTPAMSQLQKHATSLAGIQAFA
jgi:hypothetical protein